MFNRRRRIADLTEDLAELRTKYNVLRQQHAEAQEECASWKWAAKRGCSQGDRLVATARELKAAQAELRTTQDQLGQARQRIAALANTRHLTAWQNAYQRARRYKTELDQQQAVVDRLGEQLLDALGYEPDHRQLLAKEATTS